MEDEWLKNLKPGDKVIVDRHLMVPEIWTVDKVTPTGIVKIGNYSFRNGREQGRRGQWDRPAWIREATPEAVDRADMQRIPEVLRHFRWASLPLESLRAVEEIVKAKQGEEGTAVP